MRLSCLLTMLLSSVILSLASGADDEKDKEKNEKRAKLPPLTHVGNYDGEIVYVDGHSDKIVLRIKGIVPQWVQGQGQYASGLLRRLNNNSGTYVAKEEKKDISINLSPDLKVRMMYAQQGAPTGGTAGKKKEKPPTPKEMAEKDPDYKLGGNPGKKSQLSKGQIVRVSMGRNSDRINPQIYGMVVFVISEGR